MSALVIALVGRADRRRTDSDARKRIEAWRIDYNTEQLHSALSHLTPKAFARQTENVGRIS